MQKIYLTEKTVIDAGLLFSLLPRVNIIILVEESCYEIIKRS